MKRISRITCLMLSALMIVMSSVAVFAADSEENCLSATIATAEKVSGMVSVSAPYPFEFVVSTTNENTAFISFVPDTDTEYTFYLGVKGERREIFKINRTQYVVEAGEEYSFAYSYTVGDDMIVYNGTLLVTADDAGITVTPTGVVKNVTYAGDITEAVKTTYFAANSRAAGTVNESESNNTMATADRTYDDYDSFGTLGSSSDVDWWKVSFTMSGTANFWLGSIPSGCNYDISVYSQAGMLLGESNNLNQASELVQIDVTAGTYYYIKVDSAASSSSSQYLLRVKNYIPAVAPTIPSNAIGVHVTNQSGNPVENAAVYVYRQRYQSPMYPLSAVITDTNGYAVITGLSSTETYGVNVIADAYSSNLISTFISTSTTYYEVELSSRQLNQLNDPISGFSAVTVWNHNSTLSSCTSICGQYARICPHTYMNVRTPQNFGWRYDKYSRLEFHQGVDISKNVTTNTTLYNVFTNTSAVVVAELRTDTGNTIQLYSGGLYATYMHLSSIDGGVVEGTNISGGAIIGKAGDTGTYSSGTHLHLSLGTSNIMWVSKTGPVNDVYTWNSTQIQTFVDPLAYIN